MLRISLKIQFLRLCTQDWLRLNFLHLVYIICIFILHFWSTFLMDYNTMNFLSLSCVHEFKYSINAGTANLDTAFWSPQSCLQAEPIIYESLPSPQHTKTVRDFQRSRYLLCNENMPAVIDPGWQLAEASAWACFTSHIRIPLHVTSVTLKCSNLAECPLMDEESLRPRLLCPVPTWPSMDLILFDLF
jgi:hypothetical protein